MGLSRAPHATNPRQLGERRLLGVRFGENHERCALSTPRFSLCIMSSPQALLCITAGRPVMHKPHCLQLVRRNLIVTFRQSKKPEKRQERRSPATSFAQHGQHASVPQNS